MFGRKRIIYDRDGTTPYMHRWHLLFKDKVDNFSKGRKVPFNAYLHKIVLSDEPVFHDHPWDYFTVILKGGYWEHIPLFNDTTGGVVGSTRVWRGPGHFRYRRPDDLHWLELNKDKNGKEVPCWSLFFMGTKQKEWGFMPWHDGNDVTSRGYKWVNNEEYLNARNT